MKKHRKHPSASNIRVTRDRKFDLLQNCYMTAEQKKSWNRKPYGMGDRG
jgi:hypothetical protein